MADWEFPSFHEVNDEWKLHQPGLSDVSKWRKKIYAIIFSNDEKTLLCSFTKSLKLSNIF